MNTTETPLNDTVTAIQKTILPRVRRLLLKAAIVAALLTATVLGFLGYVIS